jgi:hypothetical protein
LHKFALSKRLAIASDRSIPLEGFVAQMPTGIHLVNPAW